jgi:peptidoglycan/LPS O-acetylase OafA/YrhL
MHVGVTLFFVLSGFLLYRPYVAAALRDKPSPSLRNYLLNRALRILPAYWVVLLVVAAAIETSLLRNPLQLAANTVFAQNYVPGYMPSHNGGLGIVPAWSLCVEVVFYLCVPVLGGLAIALARRGGLSARASVWIPVGFMCALGLGAKALSPHSGVGFERVWQASFLTHADWFAVGMALAVVRVLWEDRRLHVPHSWQWVALASAAASALIASKLYYGGQIDQLEEQTPLAIACGLVLSVVVLPRPRSRIVAVLQSRPFVAVGLCSYSIFLWHDPLLRTMRDHGLTLDGPIGFVVNLVMIAVISGLAAAITYRFVEKPALSRKRAWQRVAAPSTQDEPVGSTERSDRAPRKPVALRAPRPVEE